MADLVLGIDPGLHGALAFYDSESSFLVIHDMPLVERPGKKPVLDLSVLAVTIDSYARETCLAVVEAPGARPNQGLSSTYRFGESVGQLSGIVVGCFIPLRFVVPAVWKNLMGLSRDKDLSRTRASEAFPDHAHLFRRKKDADRAEAALLALFGAERLVMR